MFDGPTQKEKVIAFTFGILTGLALLGVAFLAIPSVRNSIGWRVDFALTYVRGIIDPVQPLPTAVHASISPMPTDVIIEPTTTLTPTPLPELTQPATATITLTPVPTLTPTAIPGSTQLDPPTYEKQDINNCGPATLAMHLRYYGWKGDQKTISNLIKPIPGDRNVNVEELVSYVNTEVHGLGIIYRVGGDIEVLKKLIAAGFPVTVEEAFIMQESYWINDDRWAGHYLLLTGYDDSKQVFTAHDAYVGPRINVSYQKLDENWKAFNRVYMVVYSPDQQHVVESVLGGQWDVARNRQHALDAAKKETEADPSDAFAWFNMGTNLIYFEKYAQAAIAYDHARENKLPQRMLRYQFGPFFAYFHTGRIEDLLTLTDYALDRTPNSEEAMLWRGWALYRQGDIAGAEKLFLQSLVARPYYPDGTYALNFIRGN